MPKRMQKYSSQFHTNKAPWQQERRHHLLSCIPLYFLCFQIGFDESSNSLRPFKIPLISQTILQIGKSVAREDFFRGDFSATTEGSLDSVEVQPVEDLVEKTPFGPIYIY
jgi:hypothetical protein